MKISAENPQPGLQVNNTLGPYDDISLTELKSFAGEDNYPRQWMSFLRGWRRHAGFNPWAAIFGLAWFVYRRLYLQGFIAIFSETLVPALIGLGANMLLGASDDLVEGLILPAALVAVRVALGFWANLALCRKAVQTIREVDQMNLDNESHLRMIAANGRVNIGAFFVAFGVVGVVDRYLLLGP